MYEKQRESWERLLREDPWKASRFGPPNWLVMERCGGDSAKFTEMAVKMRAEIVPTREVSPHDVPTFERMCAECSNNPREGRHSLCAKCRKRRQRDG